MMETDGVLDEKTLPREVREWRGKKETKVHATEADECQPEEKKEEEQLTLKELEQRAIYQALARYGDTTQGKKEAARQLGIGLATLYRKLEQFSK